MLKDPDSRLYLETNDYLIKAYDTESTEGKMPYTKCEDTISVVEARHRLRERVRENDVANIRR